MKTNGMIAVVLAAIGVAGYADGMDGKAKVIATVETPRSGIVEITCDDPAGWTFEPSVSEDAGRDVVTVRLNAQAVSKPPQFGVFFRVPGAGVQNVWTSDFSKDGFHLWPRLWWNWLTKYSSQLASEMPIAVGFNSTEESRVALACSETFEEVVFGLYAEEKSCDIIGRCEFFTQAAADRKEYVAKVMLDRRGRPWYETVKESAAWIDAVNGFKPADVPEAAYDPLYSTWYAYLQDVHDRELEAEARLAAQVGMKTMILDDGWQKQESKTFYSATGDWMPVKGRFPDMKRHVVEVHKAGLKYMLWLSVPFMGNEAKNYPRFKKMLLSGTDTGVLDPRFPEVREYLISTYERVVGEWGFDGVKLDFIDSFALPKEDPAVKENYAGRDYRSLPEAVDRLMKDVLSRLKKINPDVLVEFRQRYMGPAIRQYGNMIRAADCPADPTANRRRICDLRLTSGRTAVHSDMLVWSKDETPEGAALPILNVLFSTIQYSMILAKTNPEHLRVMRRWLAFTQEHRETLLKGAFRPHHPEGRYPVVEAEGARERIIAVYSPSACARVTSADKPAILVNATGAGRLLVSLPARPVRVEAFDVFGNPVSSKVPREGLSEIEVPASGHVRIEFPPAETVR